MHGSIVVSGNVALLVVGDWQHAFHASSIQPVAPTLLRNQRVKKDWNVGRRSVNKVLFSESADGAPFISFFKKKKKKKKNALQTTVVTNGGGPVPRARVRGNPPVKMAAIISNISKHGKSSRLTQTSTTAIWFESDFRLTITKKNKKNNETMKQVPKNGKGK